MPDSPLSFILDGQPVQVDLDPARDEGLTALEVLRERLGITTPKDGCQPQGQCGCCTVEIDGKAALSCLRSAESLEGRTVTTLAGLTERERDAVAGAFVDTAGLQCGFCIPGIAMRTANLLRKNPDADEKRFKAALNPHLCRCTGYVKIVEAMGRTRELLKGAEAPELSCDGGLGESPARYDGRACVLGEKDYVDDMVVPGMVHGAVRLSDHPKARVLSIDASAAEALPGVLRVFTAKDVPGQRVVGLIERDWPIFVAEGEVVHCTGSVLASVVAESRIVARRAAALVQVEYEVLEPVTGAREGLEGNPVHEGRDNLLRTCVVRRGDIEAQLAASAHVLKETFFTQRIEHAFLEPESCLVLPTERGVHVYTQGQGVHDDQLQISEVLGLPLDDVHVELVSNGGAFGGKEDLSIQHHAALQSFLLQRPVKLTLTRDQSMTLHPKRHPIEMEYTVGCDEQGHLTAVQARMYGDTGAYASVGDKVLERAAGHSCGPYRVPAVDVEAYTVYTNNPPCGAFRGFGANQAAFGIEGMLDRLAEKLGLDAYDIRERNILGPGEPFSTGQLMDSGCGARASLEAVRELYKANPEAGLACGIKNTGIGNGMPDSGRAVIHIDGPEQLTVHTGFTEMGQGFLTVMRQVVVEETGLPGAQVRVSVHSDEATTCGMTTASRATMLGCEAARRASLKLRDALQGATLADLVGQDFEGEFICDFTTKPGKGGDNPKTHVTFGYAAQVAILDETGRLTKFVAAHDVGRIHHRLSCEGQIEGAVHMGIGYALTEDMPTEGGRLLSTKLNDLRILNAKDVPEIEVILLEVPDPNTHYGTKGVGEIGLVPTAPAVAAALQRFDGIWRTRLPMRGSAAARAVLPRRLHEEDHA